MEKLINQFNLYVLFLIIIAPFIGFITWTFMGMSLENIMGALLIVTLLLNLILRKRLEIPHFMIYFLIFFIYLIIMRIHLKYNVGIKFFYSSFFVKTPLYIILIENTNFPKAYIKRMMKIIKWTVVIAVIVIIIQQVVDNSFLVMKRTNNAFNITDVAKSRLPSIFSYLVAVDVGLGFIPLLSLVIAEKLKKREKYIWFFFMIGLIYSFLTKYRWIMLNYFILFLLVPRYQKINFIRLGKIVIALLLTIVVSYYTLKYFKIPIDKIIYERILESDKKSLRQKSAGTRILAFQLFAKFFPEHPLIGTGGIQEEQLIIARAHRTSQIHVGYLSLFYYYGLIFGGIFLIFYYKLIKKVRKVAKLTNSWGPYYGILGLVVANFTLVFFYFVTMGLVLSYVITKYDYDNYKQQMLATSAIKKITSG